MAKETDKGRKCELNKSWIVGINTRLHALSDTKYDPQAKIRPCERHKS